MTHARWSLAAVIVSALVVVAGCSSSTKTKSSQQSGGQTVVGVRNVSGTGPVLVNASGRTLYISDQEMGSGRILCSTNACTAIWRPLTVAKGQRPTGPSTVSSGLSTVRRTDGSSQVTFMGTPLYTFSVDQAGGDVKGNGKHDSFGGTAFTWHAATTKGAATAPTSGAAPPPPGSGGY